MKTRKRFELSIRSSWRRFTLRSMFVVMALAGAGAGFWAAYIEPYRREARLLDEFSDNVAYFTTRPRGPWWLRKVVGDDFCQRVVWVDLDGSAATDRDLERLTQTKELEMLVIAGGCDKLTDDGLRRLEQIKDLQDLMIEGASDRVLHRLSNLKQLKALALAGDFTDDGVRQLRGLEGLRTLRLISPEISNDALADLQAMRELRELDFRGNVSDAGMRRLQSLHSLETLHCEKYPATQIAQAMDETIDLEISHAPLKDVAEALADVHSVSILLDEQALQQAGVYAAAPISISLKDVRLEEALAQLLHPLELDWTVDASSVTITTTGEAERQRRGVRALQQLLPALKDVSVDW